jgi:hypothetical protein
VDKASNKLNPVNWKPWFPCLTALLAYLLPWPGVCHASTLLVDINHATETQSGWQSISAEDTELGIPWSKVFFNGITLEMVPAGNEPLDTRDRRTINGGGDEAAMWRDFVYVPRSLGAAEGLDLLISGLIPFATYPVTVWGYDTSSRDERRSTWNGTPFVFNGNDPEPQTLQDHRVRFSITADSEGEAIIEARSGNPPGPYFNVLMNGMEMGDPTDVPDGPTGIDLPQRIAYRSNVVGSEIGTLSTLGMNNASEFSYALVSGKGDDHNASFEIRQDRLVTRKSFIAVPQGTVLSLRIRSTSESGKTFEAILQIEVRNGEEFVEPVRINEFMASDRSAHFDGDGNAVDWIELYNPLSETIDLRGYHLTDDPDNLTQWTFPDIRIPAGGFVVLYGGAPEVDGITSSDYRDAGGHYHFNFNLNAAGEFLALVRPDGRTFEFVLDPGYPHQLEDVSYGYDLSGQWAYFTRPSPGRANDNGLEGVVGDTRFSVDRGFYDTPFNLSITTESDQAKIRYTMDGSEPSPTNGLLYLGPIPINTTTTLRAMAYRDGWLSTNVDTHTYIFVEDVARQPARPDGWPDNWGTNSEVNNNDGAGSGIVPADYEMDPRVVENTLPGYGIRDALLDIPSVSIVMDQDEFIEPGRGIYAIPQSRIERACSMEYILPDGSKGFQENCKIEVHGNSSRRPWRMQKHSLRVTFTSEQGASKLQYPLFPDSPVERFNQLVLRACFTDSWGLVSWGSSRYRPNDSQYLRDVWMKESMRALGQPSSYGNFVHLYVNGLYFGLHNLTERLGDDFYASHLGGEPEDWEINEDFGSPGTRWNQMSRIDASTPEGYAEIQEYLDVENIADYFLLHFYADAEDWPHHNGYAAANPLSGDGRFRFFVWDQEIALDKFSWNPYFKADGAGGVFQKLKQSTAFKNLFADRVQKHLFNDGALSLNQSRQRYLNLANQIDKAIVAESARWGDTQASTPYGNSVQQPSPRTNVDHDHYPPAPHAPDIYFTREDSWLVERDNILDHYLPTLHDPSSQFAIVNELRSAGLFPGIDAPTISPAGGHLTINNPIQINAPEGIIYYTIDGTDPRQEAKLIQTILLNDGAPVSALIPLDDSLGEDWIQRSFRETAAWKTGRRGVGYETTPSDYKGFIGLDVGEMRNQNGSVYIRVPFELDDPATLRSMTSLQLQMRYDDGFIAYLNGVRVAQENAPFGTPGWNSLALTSHADNEATTFISFDITSHMDLLVAGTNILAIHGLNTSLTSSDLLITPRIVASRLDASSMNTSAQIYDSSLVLTESAQLKTRAFHQGEWSALVETSFRLEAPATSDHLIISEIMYHPSLSEALEFIELLNLSGQPLSLTGVRFTAGIDFDFADDAIMESYSSLVLVRNAEQFALAYPDIPFAGVFQNDSALANNGETITLKDADGIVIQSFRYNDKAPWPESADGDGFSLVLKNTHGDMDPQDPASWQASSTKGGTPGATNTSIDADQDGLAAMVERYLGTSDQNPNDAREAIQFSIEPDETMQPPGDYLTIRFTHDPLVTDIRAVVEVSPDLITWNSDPGRIVHTGTLRAIQRETLIYRSTRPVESQKQEFVRIRFE